MRQKAVQGLQFARYIARVRLCETDCTDAGSFLKILEKRRKHAVLTPVLPEATPFIWPSSEKAELLGAERGHPRLSPSRCSSAATSDIAVEQMMQLP